MSKEVQANSKKPNLNVLKGFKVGCEHQDYFGAIQPAFSHQEKSENKQKRDMEPILVKSNQGMNTFRDIKWGSVKLTVQMKVLLDSVFSKSQK